MEKEHKIISKGRFNLISNPYKWKIILGAVAGISLILTFPCILAFTGNFGQTEGNAILGLVWIGIMIIPSVIAEFIFASEKSGKPAEYTADSEKFMIREKKQARGLHLLLRRPRRNYRAALYESVLFKERTRRL